MTGHLGIALMAGVAVALAVGLAVFYRYSTTDAWFRSETRRAVLRMMVVVGPLFGMRYDPPKPERPAVMTPYGEEDAPGGEVRHATVRGGDEGAGADADA